MSILHTIIAMEQANIFNVSNERINECKKVNIEMDLQQTLGSRSNSNFTSELVGFFTWYDTC